VTDAEHTPEAAPEAEAAVDAGSAGIPAPPTGAPPLLNPTTGRFTEGLAHQDPSHLGGTHHDGADADGFSPHVFDGLAGADGAPAGSGPGSLSLLHDVEMTVTVELGRTTMALRDVLALTPGSVVELDRSAGSPVDLLVNGTLIARGEVVVIDEEFALRVTEIVEAAPRRRAG